MKYLMLFGFSLFTMINTGCKSKAISEFQEATSQQETVPEGSVNPKDEPIAHSTEKDCHGVRKTILRLTNEVGEIMKINNQYFISIPPGSTRYHPCEIPKNLQTEGKKVIFTAIMLETFPNERLIGTPIRIETIKEQK